MCSDIPYGGRYSILKEHPHEKTGTSTSEAWHVAKTAASITRLDPEAEITIVEKGIT
jgi:hypothetical protein